MSNNSTSTDMSSLNDEYIPLPVSEQNDPATSDAFYGLRYFDPIRFECPKLDGSSIDYIITQPLITATREGQMNFKCEPQLKDRCHFGIMFQDNVNRTSVFSRLSGFRKAQDDKGYVDANCYQSPVLQDDADDKLSQLHNKKWDITHNFCLCSGPCQNRSVFCCLSGFPKAQDDKFFNDAEGSYEFTVLKDRMGERRNIDYLSSGFRQSRVSVFSRLSWVPKG